MLTKADSYDFNHELFLWALSVIQPASPLEVISYLSIVLKDNGLLLTKDKTSEYFKALANEGYINQVSRKNNLYSISLNGNEQLTPELKKLRDKLRIYLLDKTRVISKVKGLASTESKKMGGASPSLQLRFVLKEVPHPSVPWALGALPNHPRNTWVRIAEQINFGSMLGEASNADTPPQKVQHAIFPLNYGSYNSIDYNLIGNTGPTILASLIGVSPHLIAIMSMTPDKYYRSFKLNKKSGGYREILAPRKFMKVIQYWITDYFLFLLNTHASCYSYRKGVSIKDNAINHLNNDFIANIDIIDYFGTINKDMVQNCLIKNKIDIKLATAITDIVTYKGTLPQGAPSSPQISNAILFDFDNEISEACYLTGCVYTRYSDDITISGSIRKDVVKMVELATHLLNEFGFSINNKKTRIASTNSRQVVTGILVNDVIRPTRKYRKRVRSAFDHAIKDNDCSKETIYKLSGYLNYLKSFQQYGYEVNTIQYELILKYLRRKGIYNNHCI
ncbi:RNA-directed DNA polymerase [Escherichia coli]|uniref:reverse transcriptase domain-containing protein n=1 Tax=Escherichia coli TaxID=562 RepID=UPI001F495799|nr:reverse transcriptase domain-containing protein [Escherichia coli]MCH7007207.1 RNA-directed DNA polymerase [Escherichia coli]